MVTEALSPADSRSYLGMMRQTAKGTGVAPTFFLPYVEGIQFTHNPNIRSIREAGGGNVIARQVKDFIAPAVQAGTPVRPDVFGALIAYFLGAEAAVSGVGPYLHTMTPADGAIWVSFERNIADDIIERIIDGLIGQLTIDYRKRDQGPEIMATAIVEGITEESQGAAAVEAYETDRPFLRSDCLWTVDTSLTPTNVESCTIALQWALDSTILADAVTRSSIVKLHLTGTVELVQLLESDDEETAYRLVHYYDGDATPGTVPGELVYPGNLQVVADYGAGAAQRIVDVELPSVNWGAAELTENNPDAREAIRITRRGEIIRPASGAPVIALVTNNRATKYLA